MKKVVILEALGISDDLLHDLQKPFEDKGVAFASFPRSTDTETLVKEVGDADGVILANMPFKGEVIRRCENLKFIDVAFTGVDHVDLAAAKEKGIAVSNASGYSNEAVAELAVGMALSLLRSIPQVEQRCRTGGTKDGLVGGELRGRTVGIVGYGNIGRRSAELFHAFGCRILATSRTRKADAPDYVTQVSLDELLAQSDFVVLHCPLNDSTRGLINGEKLALMKKDACLINVARGPVVDEEALCRALGNGAIAGAAVDVFAVEPPLPESTPLLGAPHTLLTPHVAFATKESMALRAEIVFENLRAYMEGRQQNVVL